MILTKQDLQKILKLLERQSKKDTDFPSTNILTEDSCVAIVQDGKNKRISLDRLAGFINNGVSAYNLVVDGKSVAEWISEFKDGLPEIPTEFEPEAYNINYRNTTHENVSVNNCEQALNYLFRMVKNPNNFITLATDTEINELFN